MLHTGDLLLYDCHILEPLRYRIMEEGKRLINVRHAGQAGRVQCSCRVRRQGRAAVSVVV